VSVTDGELTVEIGGSAGATVLTQIGIAGATCGGAP
jgi:hypothetical protein